MPVRVTRMGNSTLTDKDNLSTLISDWDNLIAGVKDDLSESILEAVKARFEIGRFNVEIADRGEPTVTPSGHRYTDRRRAAVAGRMKRGSYEPWIRLADITVELKGHNVHLLETGDMYRSLVVNPFQINSRDSKRSIGVFWRSREIMLAHIHEYGDPIGATADSGRIPARPFFHPTIDFIEDSGLDKSFVVVSLDGIVKGYEVS